MPLDIEQFEFLIPSHNKTPILYLRTNSSWSVQIVLLRHPKFYFNHICTSLLVSVRQPSNIASCEAIYVAKHIHGYPDLHQMTSAIYGPKII